MAAKCHTASHPVNDEERDLLWTREGRRGLMTVTMIEIARAQVRHPRITRRRTVVLERVTLHPADPRKKRHPTARHQWRFVQGAAAAAIIATVPLAHAADYDDPLPLPAPIRDVAAEVVPAPEPIEPEPQLWIAPRVPELDGLVKLEGVKANPYAQTAASERPTRPRFTRPRRVREAAQAERPADYAPARVSDLKANPYD